jgi:NAD+ diphosphatase
MNSHIHRKERAHGVQGSQGHVRGVAEAMERCGVPAVRTVRHEVNAASWVYWQTVRRQRAGEVVLLLRRRSGCYLVHTKAFYPAGTYRLPSGGIKPGEDLGKAVLRETAEETSLTVEVEAFLAIVQHHFVRGGNAIAFTSYLFLLEERGGTLRVADDSEAITGFRDVSLADVVALADALEAMPPAWRDWGRFRASVHRVVGEVLGTG